MAFIKNDAYKKITELAKNGDERAKALIDHYMRKDYRDQADLDRMVSNVFNPLDPDNQPEEEIEEKKEEEIVEDTPDNATVEIEEGVVEQPAAIAETEHTIDADMDGLVDAAEIDQITFEEFLKNKSRDSLRARRNHDYFTRYDANARNGYLEKKKDEYNHSFDTMRGDIERGYRDMDRAISKYALSVGDLIDDGVALDDQSTASAYDDIVSESAKSHSFGRSWDEDDMANVVSILQNLVAKYGRKNVLGALNILRGDNEAFRTFRNGKIDAAVGKYGKSLDDLLK